MKDVLDGMVEGGLMSWRWMERCFEVGSSVLGKRIFVLRLNSEVRVVRLVVLDERRFRSLRTG